MDPNLNKSNNLQQNNLWLLVLEDISNRRLDKLYKPRGIDFKLSLLFLK